MEADVLYERLRWIMSESEARAYLAALPLLRAVPRLSLQERRIYSALWLYVHVVDPERSLIPRQRLDFSLFPLEKWRSYFRFAPSDVLQVRQLLGIDHVYVTDDGHRMLGDDALLLLLRRMSSPQRHIDIEDEFGISKTASSTITLSLIRALHTRWFTHLYCAHPCFSQGRLHQYAQAVSAKVKLLTGVSWPAEVGWAIIAFLDGSFHVTCEPSDEYPGQDLQASAYSGYEKAHGLRFHHLLFPDGIVGHVSPFIAGRQPDATLWRISLIAELLRRHVPHIYKILTDMGYAADEHIAKPTRNPLLLRDIALNQILASLRIPNEWSFGIVRRLFAGVVHMREVRLTPIAQWWHIAVLLTNCYTCLYGGNPSHYFEMLPLTLEQYLERH